MSEGASDPDTLTFPRDWSKLAPRMIDLADIVEPEWLDWYKKTPQERLLATEEAWEIYLELGGSLDPDPDPQSPFWSREELEEFARHAKAAPERAFGKSLPNPK